MYQDFCSCSTSVGILSIPDDVIGQTDMASRPDVILLTSIHDSKRQTYVYRTSVEQAAEKVSHSTRSHAPYLLLEQIHTSYLHG